MKAPSYVRRALVSVCVANLLVAQTLAGPDRGPDSRNFPNLELAGHFRGQQAIQALGRDLPGIAKAYGLDRSALQDMLSADETLTVDRKGRLHYVEPVPGAGAAVAGASSLQAIAPLADTFRLHSRPSAKRIIYLDFDGQVITGTAWNAGYNGGNPIVAPAWSIDVDATTFNDEERTTIQYIWQRVAEDYAPFDVDVTTELISEDQITRADVADEYYGTRVLISPISSYFGYFGGIAYVGAFSSIGDYYKPALVFPENLGPNGENYIAEAITHESGHNLGLNHDGTTTGCGATGLSPCGYFSGNGNWAPIMGVGYYVSIVQWSRGEYANANNLQDDLSIVASYVGFRADDHGDTTVTATALPAGSQLFATGVITTSADVDVFSFTAGTGPASINLNPDNRSANLDILAELRDASGNLVASSNPLGALNASFSLNLISGTYYVFVRGTGEGDPVTSGYSAYGSVGQYTLSGTVVDPAAQRPIAIATVSPAVVAVGQAATFNGISSYDPDGGALVAFRWDFSDGASGIGPIVSKSFASPGTYTATLTVTDDEGTTGTSTVSLRANSPPVAGISVSPAASGTAPLALTFSGAGSTDADGTITSYAWNFGDGTSGSGLTVAKTYTAAGTYTARLTVTDNNGATGTKTTTVTVSNSVPSLRVQFITLALVPGGGGYAVRATIKITNLEGTPIQGAKVNGNWLSIFSGNESATTDASGNAVVTSSYTKKHGLETFTVTGVSKSGYTYNPINNLMSIATIVVP